MLPQTNARLTAVNGATAATGGRDDWDAPGAEPAGAGAQKWIGDAPAYYQERVTRLEDTGGGEANVVQARTLYLETATARAIGIDTDDVITFTDPAGVSRTGNAQVVTYSELAGVPSGLQTTRIELTPA